MRLQLPVATAYKSIVRRISVHNSNSLSLYSSPRTTFDLSKPSGLIHIALNYVSTSPQIQSDHSTVSFSSSSSSNTLKSSSSSSWVLSQNEITSGQIWHYLQREKMGPQKDISIAEWTRLVTVSKPHTPSDARLIRTALLDLNRCSRNFKLNRDMAKDSIIAMMRSMMPEVQLSESVQWKEQVEAGIFVGNVFLEKASGLHVSVETQVLNQQVLEPLWKSIQYIQTLEEDEAVQQLYPRILHVVTGIVDLLWERCSKPMRQMKKRAARSYKRKLSCTQGPSPETIDLAVRICVEIGKKKKMNEEGEKDTKDPRMVAEQMLQELENRKWLGLPMKETKKYMEQ